MVVYYQYYRASVSNTGCFIISVLIIRFNRVNSLYDIIINYAPYSSTLNNIL